MSGVEKEDDEATVIQQHHQQELAEANRQREQNYVAAFKNLTAREHLTAALALLKPTATKNEEPHGWRGFISGRPIVSHIGP